MLYKLKDGRHKLYKDYEIHNMYENQYDICNIWSVRYIWKKTYRDITHILNIQNKYYIIYIYIYR